MSCFSGIIYEPADYMIWASMLHPLVYAQALTEGCSAAWTVHILGFCDCSAKGLSSDVVQWRRLTPITVMCVRGLQCSKACHWHV